MNRLVQSEHPNGKKENQTVQAERGHRDENVGSFWKAAQKLAIAGLMLSPLAAAQGAL